MKGGGGELLKIDSQWGANINNIYRALVGIWWIFIVTQSNPPPPPPAHAINSDQAPVVRSMDNTIQWVNLYPVDSAISFVNTYPLDSDLSLG